MEAIRQKIDMKKLYVFMTFLFVTGFAQQSWKSPEVIRREMESRYRVAQQYERQGQIEKALEVYRYLFAKNPKNSAYYTRYIRLLFNQKNTAELDKVIQKYLELNPESENALVDRGKLYFVRGDTAMADEFWKKSWEEHNYSQSFARTLFNTLISMSQFNRAENVIHIARDHYNRPDMFAVKLANFQMMRGNYMKSAAEYLRFGRQNRRNYDYISNQILKFPADSNLCKGVDSLIQIELLKTPESAELHLLRADLFFKAKDYNRAIEQMMIVENSRSFRGNNILDLAVDLLNVGQYKRAEQVYTLIIKEPQFRSVLPRALLGLAEAFEKEMLAERPCSPFDYFFRDNFFFVPEYIYGFGEDDYNIRRAFSIYDSLIVSLPRSDYAAKALIRLAELRYRVLQDIDGAARLYSDALKSSVNANLKNICRIRLIDLQIVKGDLTKARQTINQAIEYSQSIEKELSLRKLLLSYYSFEMDSISAFSNNLLGMLGVDDPRFNDVVDFQNFTDQFLKNSESDAARDFVKSELLIRQNKLSEARELLSYLMENYSDAEIAIPAGFRLLQIELFFHNREAAERVLMSLLNQNSQFDADALLMMGELAQFRDNDNRYAAKWYQQLLEQYPGSFMSDEVRKRLRRIQTESLISPES